MKQTAGSLKRWMKLRCRNDNKKEKIPMANIINKDTAKGSVDIKRAMREYCNKFHTYKQTETDHNLKNHSFHNSSSKTQVT